MVLSFLGSPVLKVSILYLLELLLMLLVSVTLRPHVLAPTGTLDYCMKIFKNNTES
jgi:hypothetical protein